MSRQNPRGVLALLVGLGWRAAPGQFAGSLVAATVGAAATVCYPVGYHLVVDGVLGRQQAQVVTGAALVAVLFTLAWTLGMVGSSRTTLLTDRVHLHLGERIARLVNTAPGLEHFEDPELLREIEQLRDDRRTLASGLRQVLSGWQVVIRGVGITVLLATVYPPVLLVPVLGAAPALAARQVSRIQKRAGDELASDRRLLDDLFTLATTAGAAKELRIYGLTGAVASRHAGLGERVRSRSVSSAVRGAAWEALGAAVYTAGFVGVVVLLVLRAAHGHDTPGQVVMAVSLMRRAQAQVASASDTAGTLAAAVRTARRLLWLEGYVGGLAAGPVGRQPATGRVTEVGEPVPVPDRFSSGIRLERVSFGYPGGGEVLHGVDLELPAGSTVAVVGENGAGKTTLAKLLTGMYRPGEGRILLDGTDLAAVAPGEWRARATAVFQDFMRLQLLLRQSVGVGDLARIDDDEAVGAALARARAGDLPGRFPDGLDTLLGRLFTGGRDLSGGQWQRVALARSLMRDRPLLTVLDEPTASLDAASEAALFARFAEIARDGAASGSVTLLISHRFSTVRMADLIVVLDAGRVVESGDHDGLLALGGVYAELFTLQARAYLQQG